MVSELYLQHHGVKGMKWGVRRYQNEDGSLTAEGEKRYNDPSKIKSDHRIKLERKYIEKGMSETEAKIAADKRIKAEIAVAALAGVTVASCVAYCAYKNYNTDKSLSDNVEFHRIAKFKEDELGFNTDKHIYMAYGEKDKTVYKGVYGKALKKGFLGIEDSKAKIADLTITPKNGVKLASQKRQRDTFEKMWNSDANFKKEVKDMINKHEQSILIPVPGHDTHSLIIKVKDKLRYEPSRREVRGEVYDAFNASIPFNNREKNNAVGRFFGELRSQGVNAIKDLNDGKYGSYKTKDPIIFFDKGYKVTQRLMTNNEINKAYNKGMGTIYSKHIIDMFKKNSPEYGVIAATIGTSIGIKSRLSKQAYKKSNPNKRDLTFGEIRKAETKAAVKYYKEHPNTNKSMNEIIKMLYSKNQIH